MGTGKGSTLSTWVVGAVAIVVGLLVGAVVAVVLLSDDSDTAAVTLERADEPGDDPFTDSVQVGETPVLEQPAIDAASDVRADLPQDPATTVLVAAGTEPGLYGGSGSAQVCDPDKLIAYLADHPDKARAFGDVLGIRPEGISDYVASLTPVVLLSDTLVTNHGFRDGRATELTSVLQAGTAVMVDPKGVPRVKCNCGNPLSPPEVVPTSDWDVRGEAWDGFDAAKVTGVLGGNGVEELTLCDLMTGRRYTIVVGRPPSEGTPGPNLEGEWTLSLRTTYDLTVPLPPDQLAQDCPTAALEGATLSVRRAGAAMAGLPGFGYLVGAVEGLPPGSPAFLEDIQATVNGAVIRLRPEGEDIPEFTLNVATTSDTMSGIINVTIQDRAQWCDVGVVATRVGSANAGPTTTSTTTISSTTTTTNAASTPTPAQSVDPCASSTIAAAVQTLAGGPVVGLVVQQCNGRWVWVSHGRAGQDDSAVLEWNGAAWEPGVCERYRDPDDWTASPVVPPEFWTGCIVD